MEAFEQRKESQFILGLFEGASLSTSKWRPHSSRWWLYFPVEDLRRVSQQLPVTAGVLSGGTVFTACGGKIQGSIWDKIRWGSPFKAFLTSTFHNRVSWAWYVIFDINR